MMTSNEPGDLAKKYPPGNAKVGDAVWVFRTQKDQVHGRVLEAVVSEVGFPNGHGYNLNIQITFADGHDEIVSPYDHKGFSWEDGPRIIILPPADEIPEEMKELMMATWSEEEQKRVVPVRYGHNCDQEVYVLLCTRCYDHFSWYWVNTEASDFRWWGDSFSCGKPEIADSEGEILSCGCTDGEDTLACPEHEGYC